MTRVRISVGAYHNNTFILSSLISLMGKFNWKVAGLVALVAGFSYCATSCSKNYQEGRDFVRLPYAEDKKIEEEKFYFDNSEGLPLLEPFESLPDEIETLEEKSVPQFSLEIDKLTEPIYLQMIIIPLGGESAVVPLPSPNLNEYGPRVPKNPTPNTPQNFYHDRLYSVEKGARKQP